MEEYQVQQGDCIESIAFDHGFNWKTLWNLPENAALRTMRKDPNVLLPADIVKIPDKTLRWESKPTERRHVFVRGAVPSRLVLVLKDLDRPRARERYALDVEGRAFTGETDEEGRIEVFISPAARQGRLVLGSGSDVEEYPLQLGQIDPIAEAGGVKERLKNLGFESIEEFQRRHRLDITGEADAATLEKLKQEYGC